jgi:glycosyltransferase involved in cell wall biosynthesis
MLLEAACELLRDGRMTVEIVGDGPQMAQLREMVSREKLERPVMLSGWVEHAKVQDRLVEADVLCFPSIREFGGGVALEAMAVGVVPVVPRYGGLGELVTDETGFLIEMGDRKTMIARLRQTLEQLVETPSLIDAKSDVAFRRAHEQFTWSAKAQQTLKVYDWVTGQNPQRPEMLPPA